MSEYVERATCRLCGAAALEPILKLEPTPPANEFLREPTPQATYPLWLARCRSCDHVQLPVVVDPEVLFRHYVYVSGTSPAFVRHFEEYADVLCGPPECPAMKPGDLVVEIGSNDGTMLRCFQKRGMEVLGVDPAVEIGARARAAGIPTLTNFFTSDLARSIRAEMGQGASLIVANNVFAHADDLWDIAVGVRDLLRPDGLFVFEVQYLVDLVDKCLFDMVYHEHLSYHHVTPLVPFFHRLGMSLVHVDRVPTHGGSIRCHVVRLPDVHGDLSVSEAVLAERGALAPSELERFRFRIERARNEFRRFLDAERAAGRWVVGYGAPAKLTTLLHHFGVTAMDVTHVVDDSPWKHGTLTPGLHIPVVAELPKGAETVVVFAWNFADSIAAKLRAAGFRGKIVSPLDATREIP